MRKFQPIFQELTIKNIIKKSFFVFAIVLFCKACESKLTKSKKLLFVGSFTDKKPGEGIYVYEFDDDTETAELKSNIVHFPETLNRHYLTLHLHNLYLLFVSESIAVNQNLCFLLL